MQLFLQSTTEQYCERSSSKCAHSRDFASAFSFVRMGKGSSYADFQIPSQANRR